MTPRWSRAFGRRSPWGRQEPSKLRTLGLELSTADVAALLVRGRSPSEVADELAMAENTVRTHVRHVFDKTGVERMSDLIRLMMQGPGVRVR